MTRRPGIPLLLLSFSLATMPACDSRPAIELTRNGITDYRIVLSPMATEVDRQAASVLQEYIERISGARIPIDERGEISETGNLPGIHIGSAPAPPDLPLEIDWASLEEDGFRIVTAGEDLIIAGGTAKGSLYGIHTLLESYLGCRMYGPDMTIVPEEASIRLPPIDDTQVPVIRFRSTHYDHAYEQPYTGWHKLDDGNVDRFLEWSTRVHTFNRLVPPEEYFADHPDYFSEINGIRVPDTQLCLTNEDVYRIVVERLREMMAEHPGVKYWSVSQNDTYGNCQCDECRALDEREGGPIGSLLTFVNRVAAEFPDRIITTLAYQYSRSAPKTLKPADNVCITLCSIECNRSAPLDGDPGNAAFVSDVQEWSEIASHLYIWDYVVQFRNLVSPFPNFHVLQPNIQFFVENGIDAIFEQGSGGIRGEFTDLRSYLIAKLLWNPDADVDAIIDDFLAAYYGEAAPWLRRYIDTMTRELKRSGERLDIYGNPYTPVEGYLSPRLMDRYERLLDRAETAVTGSPDALLRVRHARLPLEYARLEQARRYGTGDLGFFVLENGAWSVRPEMRRRLDAFIAMCEEAGYDRLHEHGGPPQEYRQVLLDLFDKSMESHLALFKPVTVRSEWSPTYPANGVDTFTDGLKGIPDYTCNWIGFEGHDMDVVIDLEEITMVSEISTDFLQLFYSWVWLPTEVVYSVSGDGENFTEVARITNTVSDQQDGAFIHTFSARFTPVEARHVRVEAVNMKVCPEWHQGHPGRSWIFADEIIVR